MEQGTNSTSWSRCKHRITKQHHLGCEWRTWKHQPHDGTVSVTSRARAPAPLSSHLSAALESPRAHLRLESMRDDLSKRIGWFKTPGMETEYTGVQYQPKSKQAQEQERSRPWLKQNALAVVRDDQAETQGFLQRAPRMTNQPGLPALLRMPEVPAPPSHLVASVTAPKTMSKMEQPSKVPSKNTSKNVPSKRASVASVASRARAEPPAPLRWPQAPAPPTPPGQQEHDERLRRVAEASTPPMSPRES